MSLVDDDGSGFPHEVSIYRVVLSQGAMGGDSEALAASPYSADTPAWIQPSNANTIKEYAKRDQRVTHDVYFLSDPGLKLTDVIRVVTGPAAMIGEDLTVRGFREATAGMDVATVANCENSREGL